MKVSFSPEQQNNILTGSMSVLGKEEFLRLLTTQLRYQDPLNPMEDTEFVAQLAQFSSLEQMFNLNDSFDASVLLSQSVNNTLATNLIGREAKVRSDTGQLGEEGSLRFEYDIANSAQVSIEVVDEYGNVVYQENIGAVAKGSHEFAWDGTTEGGSRADDGSYSLRVKAVDQTGDPVDTNVYLLALVDGVSFSGGSAYLIVGGSEIPLASVAGVMML
jgi:flagellar basal-body rod modification protein FlgD